jgi:hypothetical protein
MVNSEVNPHKFRYHFSHTFLGRGDLMKLNGWVKSQILARHGRSARSAGTSSL